MRDGILGSAEANVFLSSTPQTGRELRRFGGVDPVIRGVEA